MFRDFCWSELQLRRNVQSSPLVKQMGVDTLTDNLMKNSFFCQKLQAKQKKTKKPNNIPSSFSFVFLGLELNGYG